MKKMRGDQYGDALVTDQEVQHKLEEVKTGMMMAYNYAQGQFLFINLFLFCLLKNGSYPRVSRFYLVSNHL